MTSRFIYDRREDLIAWAEARGGFRFRDDATTIGVERCGELCCVTVFDTWATNNAFVHIVSDGSRRWFSREYAVRTMAYCFIQAGLPRISAIVSEQNEASLAFTRGFGGWVEEGRLRRAAPDGKDLILFGMLRECCRFLPENNPLIYRF